MLQNVVTLQEIQMPLFQRYEKIATIFSIVALCICLSQGKNLIDKFPF